MVMYFSKFLKLSRLDSPLGGPRVQEAPGGVKKVGEIKYMFLSEQIALGVKGAR